MLLRNVGVLIGSLLQASCNMGKFVLSETARCYLLMRAILQEINGEKRPEKTKDYFIVSNSTLFEISVVFI